MSIVKFCVVRIKAGNKFGMDILIVISRWHLALFYKNAVIPIKDRTAVKLH
ncbi:hypothetical protein GCM10025855_41390 [Shewanella glacialipiscicola]|uniref:Uncharacterized protein n=1 Tax=Shewanella glacialipiscicola TaxID=614069 RepID=A0ABQ6J4F0_9GAMM|nr:hypothetical protein GCM10025855_12630 [Shewanella glacialipiscicola]GMA84605.1 hypothetical protein GCM10025855_41390 [Shewanella glacialipiscicola]